MQLVVALAAHVLVALVVGLTGRRLGRHVLLLAALAPAIAFGIAVSATPAVLDGEVVRMSADWVPGMGLTVDLALDAFGLLFWWIIAGVGVLIMLYAWRYFEDRDDLGRFAALLVTFAGAMLLLTSADDVYALFVAWEITSITSYLLIGFNDRDTAARASALQALLVTGGGGLALLGGLVLVSQGAGTSSLSGILAAAPTGGVVEAGLVLVLLGAMTKSAQVPFHFWLPGAMSAPTPVSAYLHSATMVKAGIYLLARFGPAFAPSVDWWTTTLVVVGGSTMLLGGWRALRETDLKALLAFGTVSQLGFIVLLVGHGAPEMVFAGVAVLLAHSLFKATLFMSVGVVDHAAHTRDVRRLQGIGRIMPVTAVAATLAAASMAGVIPLFGFVSKEAALYAAYHLDAGKLVVLGLITAGSVLTAAYAIRFVRGAFLNKPDDELRGDAVDPADVHAPDRLFELPGALLTVLTVVFALVLAPIDEVVALAAGSLVEGGDGFHLELWHGLGIPLYLSTGILVLGAILWRWQSLAAPLFRLSERVPEARSAYRGGLRGLFELADRTVAIVQPGSLPIYLGVILMTLVILPGTVLLRGVPIEIEEFASSPLQAAVAAGIVAAAIGTAVVRKRLSTVLLLGGVGFGVAVLFVLHGAPDLALTQLLIDTLSIGIFVLVLRKLPENFTAPAFRLGNGVRIVISLAVGGLVTIMALAVTTVRTGAGSADQFLARALPEGGGKNVVNVILTDFRALDTLGEVTVLAVAAVGVLSMVRATRQDDDGSEVEPGTDTPGDGEDAAEPAEVAS